MAEPSEQAEAAKALLLSGHGPSAVSARVLSTDDPGSVLQGMLLSSELLLSPDGLMAQGLVCCSVRRVSGLL
jgi:hypothetical protein